MALGLTPPPAPATEEREGAERFGILLVPGFSMMAFLSVVEPLRVANRLAGRDLYAWRAFSRDGAPVDASNGMTLMVGGALGDARDLSSFLVCAGFSPERHAAPALLRGLGRLARARTVMGGIDTGAYLLAAARLLDAVTVTMHWEALPAFREAFPHIPVTEALYRIERDRITCAGGAAAMDLMLDRIAARHGSELALAVGEQLLHDRIRQAGDGQRAPASAGPAAADPRLRRALALMEKHLAAPLPKARLAAACGVSVRQLERLFHAGLHTAPAARYLALRLTRARHLLRQSQMDVTEVAEATGFSCASALSRAYRLHFGLPPSRDRQEPPRWRATLAVKVV